MEKGKREAKKKKERRKRKERTEKKKECCLKKTLGVSFLKKKGNSGVVLFLTFSVMFGRASVHGKRAFHRLWEVLEPDRKVGFITPFHFHFLWLCRFLVKKLNTE